MSAPENVTAKVTVTDRIRDLGAGRRARYQVRWKVDGVPEKSAAFATRKAARTFQARLIAALSAGALFDRATREPVFWGTGTGGGPTAAEYTRDFIAAKWPTWKPRTRRSEIEEAAAWLPALVTRDVAERETLYKMLVAALHPNQELNRTQADLWRRFVSASRPLAAVRREHMAHALSFCRTKLDGTPAAATYGSRRRASMAQVLLDAVANEVLDRNPLEHYREPKSLKATTKVEAAEVGEAWQVRAVFDKLAKSRYLLLFALMFYAGLRPSEAVMVRWGDLLTLPTDGWGMLRLRSSASEAGRAYTDTGEVRQENGLKAREDGEVRLVPLAPVLVALLLATRPNRARRDAFVCAGRVKSRPVSGSTLDTTWKGAVAAALPDADGRLLYRCYSLRHSAASLWLGAGAPPAVIAKRLGHTVEMLLSVYADVLESHEAVANARIESAMAEVEVEVGVGT